MQWKSLTVQLVHGQDIVVVELEVLFGSFVVREHDGAGHGRVRQSKTVAQLVHGHCKEVHA